MENKLVEYIMDRKTMDASMFELNKMLKFFNVESYSKMCTDRIVDEIGIDFKDVLFQPDNLHIMLTYWGIERCKDILSSYLNDEQLNLVIQEAKEQQEYILSQNNLLWLLRSKSRKELKGMRAEAALHGLEDEKEYMSAELRSRRLNNRLRVILKERFTELCIRVRYHKLWRSVKSSIRNFEAKVKRGEMPSVVPSDRLAIIRKNFEKYRRITRRSNSTDDLKRLVFYGILAYENSSRLSINGRKSCAQIEKEYKDMSNIIQAAAQLTPRDFMNIFPISKEYDGERYGTKDYFYTKEALKAFPMNEKIGDRIILFFEKYYGDHVFLFWVNYFCCMDDYSNYCGVKEPVDNYFKRVGAGQN